MISTDHNTEARMRLAEYVPNSAFAFRGYNVRNLGRSHELLAQPAYRSTITEELWRASELCAEVARRPVDLVGRVSEQQETTLESYDEAIALIMAMEVAQLRILRDCHGVDYHACRVAMGYSLGELAAVVASGLLPYERTLRVPLELAADCVALAHDTTLGVLFSRTRALQLDAVRKLCLEINTEGKGVAGISAVLSPNSVLLMGQGDTLQEFKSRMHDEIQEGVALRLHHERWPPMHTPLVWAKNIPNRAAEMMHTIPGGFAPPHPPILSLVTGEVSYNQVNVRETLHRWVDHPQRLWDAIQRLLVMGIETVVHVGPAPNIMPATFQRISDNVTAQIRGNVGVRVLSHIAHRPWLKGILPERTALLRAPKIQHIILEEWLLEHAPAHATSVQVPELPMMETAISPLTSEKVAD